MLSSSRWLVVGDVLNPRKPAYQIVQHLAQHQRIVHPIDPRIPDQQLFSLQTNNSDRPQPLIQPVNNSVQSSVDGLSVADLTLDLCVNPSLGIEAVKQAHRLGIKRIFIQPGAESSEILRYCSDVGIETHQGCVLREMR